MKEPDEPVRAADCPRTFVLMAEGGVRVRYACGTVEEFPEEEGVDVVTLEANVTRHHHHHRVHLPHIPLPHLPHLR